MADLLAALGLVLAFEGLCFAAFPSAVKRAASEVAAASLDTMRIVGVIGAVAGVALLWVVRVWLR